MQNYISSCLLDMYPCDFFHSLHSSLCSKLTTGSHLQERRGVIAKYLLLKKTLEETCFPASWIKATLGWYRNGKNSSLASYLSSWCYQWPLPLMLRSHCWVKGFYCLRWILIMSFWACVLLLLSLWRERGLWDTVLETQNGSCFKHVREKCS